MSTIDPNEFRQALGSFATGVTVITSVDTDKQPVGVTASSFNSVSLDPPLVLWSLAKDAKSLGAFQTFGYFCVHVLAADQQVLSGQFASRGGDKFEELSWRPGEGGVPLLPKFAAQFQCKTLYQYEGGDHIIFVGEVLEYERTDNAPLVFHAGRYALAKVSDANQRAGDGVDVAEGTFTSEYFMYLLSRAHYQSTYPLAADLQAAQMNRTDYLLLTLLGLSGPLSYQALRDRLEHTGHLPTAESLRLMQARELISVSDDETRYTLTEQGRCLHITLLAKSKAIEEHLLGDFSSAEVADMRSFLQRFIEKSDPGVPDFFGAAVDGK